MVDADGKDLKEQPGQLAGDSAAEVGYGIRQAVEILVRKARDEDLYSDQYKEDRKSTARLG